MNELFDIMSVEDAILNTKKILFLDDNEERWKAFVGWSDKTLAFPCQAKWVKTYEECIDELNAENYDILCLDNDLGTRKEGKDVVVYLEELVENNEYIPSTIIIHTANSPARKHMVDGLMRIKNKGKEITIDVLSFDTKYYLDN